MSNIVDIRTSKDFLKCTFSNFKKVDVQKELQNSILKNQIESACYWSAELICSGHFEELWDIIFLIMSKYIHLGNPRLAIYINLRCNKFKEIVNTYDVDNEIEMRNNINIRVMFAEICCVLCLSDKLPAFEPIKILPGEFTIMEMSTKFKAPDVNFGISVSKPNDPKEIYVAINELAYNLKITKNLLNGCYWVEWIIEYDKLCKKHKKTLECEVRDFVDIQNKKLINDPVWIIWELLLQSSKEDPNINSCLLALLNLYSLKFTQSSKNKRKYILYLAIELLTNSPSLTIDIITDNSKEQIETVCKNINKVYNKISLHSI